jgi:hypothetical protein
MVTVVLIGSAIVLTVVLSAVEAAADLTDKNDQA